MFAVAGTWTMDAAMRQQQQSMLPRLVDGVMQNRGFVRGFWADDLERPERSVTFIVFETLEQARDFRSAVMANAPAQAGAGVECEELRILEIHADA
jgi:hypothetical protein